MAERVESILAVTLDDLIEHAPLLGATSAAEVEQIAERAVRDGHAIKLIRGDEIRYGLTRERGES